MKHLRTFILVLLAVLLPIRGAVAATMLCPESGGTSTAVVVAEQGHHGMQADHATHAEHSAAHHHASADAADDDSRSGQHPATCHLCASGCCMVSIVGSVPSVAEPGLTSSVTFRALTALIPAFHSGGQDRPPRTI